jgi:hypothetical protein
MTDIQQTTDPINWEVDKNKLPEMLNVLTILTFIGSGLGAITTVWGLLKPPPSEAYLQDMQDKYDKAPDIVKSFMGPHVVDLTRKTMENRIPLLLLAIVGIGLCVYGAMQMRARKKQGFTIYLIGELALPLISMALFVGFGYYTGFSLALNLFLPVLFIILYASQLKYLS